MKSKTPSTDKEVKAHGVMGGGVVSAQFAGNLERAMRSALAMAGRGMIIDACPRCEKIYDILENGLRVKNEKEN